MRSFLTLLFFIPSIIFAQTKTLPLDVVKNIRLRIDEGTNPSIVIGIIDKDGPAYFSYGLTKEGGKKVNEHTLYEIGSITKVFTATLLAQEVLKGNMHLDDPVSKYLPSHVRIPSFDGQQITLGHLSDHTSSLPRLPNNLTPDDPGNPYADYTIEELYSFLNSCELSRAIGSEYEYSNLAVGLLGHILALHTGKSYEELVKERITGPLQMKETAITLNKKLKKKLAPGHFDGNIVPNWDLPAFAGAGAIRSSVYDMLKFLSAELQLNQTSLSDAMQLTQQPRHHKAGDSQMGLGWFMTKGSEGDIIWHGGATGGYTTFAGINKSKGLGVVVFTNSNNAGDDIGFRLLDPLSPLRQVLPHITTWLKEVIDTEGPNDLIEKFEKQKKESGDKYDYSEMGINDLGYYYLNRRMFKEAQALFLLNIHTYPHSSNVYDSYAESLMEDGQKEKAIEYYKRSLEINPGNTNAVDMLAKMGVTAELPEIKLDTTLLEKYVGTYQLFPGFDLVITREGNKLMAQATGQSMYEIFPKSETEFYYKVVDAQIDFNLNDDGKVESLTLHQGGRDIEGKKK